MASNVIESWFKERLVGMIGAVGMIFMYGVFFLVNYVSSHLKFWLPFAITSGVIEVAFLLLLPTIRASRLMVSAWGRTGGFITFLLSLLLSGLPSYLVEGNPIGLFGLFGMLVWSLCTEKDLKTRNPINLIGVTLGAVFSIGITELAKQNNPNKGTKIGLIVATIVITIIDYATQPLPFNYPTIPLHLAPPETATIQTQTPPSTETEMQQTEIQTQAHPPPPTEVKLILTKRKEIEVRGLTKTQPGLVELIPTSVQVRRLGREVIVDAYDLQQQEEAQHEKIEYAMVEFRPAGFTVVRELQECFWGFMDVMRGKAYTGAEERRTRVEV